MKAPKHTDRRNQPEAPREEELPVAPAEFVDEPVEEARAVNTWDDPKDKIGTEPGWSYRPEPLAMLVLGAAVGILIGLAVGWFF